MLELATKSPILVFSTYTQDKIIDINGKEIRTQSEGPMLFLEKALKDLNIRKVFRDRNEEN